MPTKASDFRRNGAQFCSSSVYSEQTTQGLSVAYCIRVLQRNRASTVIYMVRERERESFKGLAHADVGLTSLQSAVRGGRNLHCSFESKDGPEKNSFRFKSEVANPPGET